MNNYIYIHKISFILNIYEYIYLINIVQNDDHNSIIDIIYI